MEYEAETLDTVSTHETKRRAWVIYQISLQGRSLAEIARDAGVKRQTLYRVFDAPYPRMEQIIADALNLKPDDLFPERYNNNGQPNRNRGRPHIPRPHKSTVKSVEDTACDG